jgi:hypothetical protein
MLLAYAGRVAGLQFGELGVEPLDLICGLGESEPLLPLDVECSPHAVGEVGAAVELR